MVLFYIKSSFFSTISSGTTSLAAVLAKYPDLHILPYEEGMSSKMKNLQQLPF
jgi:hypothetical protein